MSNTMNNTRDLRAFLVSQMNGVAAGTTNMEQAKAISNLSQQVYNTLNIEVKIAVARAKMGDAEIAPVEFS